MIESGLRSAGDVARNAPGFAALLLLNRVNSIGDGSQTYPDDTATAQPFKPYYDKHILPRVQAFEARRLAALRTLRQRCYLAVPGLAALIAAVYLAVTMLHEEVAKFALGGGLIAAFSLFWWVASPIQMYKTAVKSDIFPLVFRFYGDEFKYSASGQLSVSSLKQAGILPVYDRASTEDYVGGVYKGVKIELTEATLERESGKQDDKDYKTIFHGLFLVLSMNKAFKGHTIVRRDRGRMGNWMSGAPSGMERVRLEDPVFEEKFEAYSTDQVEARYLLTTSFMDRLVKLADLVDATEIQCAFFDKQLLMTLRSDINRFETASIFKPATFVEDTTTILAQMREVFSVIDILKLNENTRL